MEDGYWMQSKRNLSSARWLAGRATYRDENLYQTVITGGYNKQNGSLNTGEFWQNSDWFPLQLPVKTHWHCSCFVNQTFLILIGGKQNDVPISAKTHLFDGKTEVWSDGPQLAFGRASHACARIRQSASRKEFGANDVDDAEFSVIVVGGYDGQQYLKSVEILDEGANAWRRGQGKLWRPNSHQSRIFKQQTLIWRAAMVRWLKQTAHDQEVVGIHLNTVY
jgi:hypothetical protein